MTWATIRNAMRGSFVLDGRNVLHGGVLEALGFRYRSFGRLSAPAPRAARPASPAMRPVKDTAAAQSHSTRARRTANPVS